MSTFMPKADEIERKWYVIDAAGKPLGRVAAEAATLLRGKHKAIFTPSVDCGDFVIDYILHVRIDLLGSYSMWVVCAGNVGVNFVICRGPLQRRDLYRTCFPLAHVRRRRQAS